MPMDIANVMDGIATNLGTIDGLRITAFPADNVMPPAAQVLFPETLDYDETMARGADRATFRVDVLVSRADDRASALALAPYMSGTGDSSVKAAIEADPTLDGSADTARVTRATVNVITIASVAYLAATFDIDVVA